MQDYLLQHKKGSSFLREDGLLLLFLFISVSHFIFQWYEVFFIIPVFLILIGKPLTRQCQSVSSWLFVFSLLYLLGCHLHGGIGSRSQYVIYLFPPVFFMVGSYLGNKYKYEENLLMLFLFIVMFMYSVYDLVQLLSFVFEGGELVIENREVLDENGEITHGATGYAVLLSVLIAGISFIIAPIQKGFLSLIRIIGASLGVLAVFGMASIVTRTSLIEVVAVLLFSFYMMMTEKKKRGVILGFVVLLLGFYYLTKLPILSKFVDAYRFRAEFGTYGYESAGGRFMRWWAALQDLFYYPFGTPTGRITRLNLSGAYAHNMWLDVGLRAGWGPMIILIAVSIRNIRQSFSLLKDHSYNYFTRLYCFSLFLVFLLGCSVEPILDGVFNHFLVYLFFCGMISEMNPKTTIDTLLSQ